MAPPTPSDSAGGSNAATAEEALPPQPPAPAAHHAAPAPNLPAQPPTANAHPPDAATSWMPPPAPAPTHPAHSHGGGGGGGPQPAHSMQNSVFTARRWDRATGSTSTVGGVGVARDSDRDSAGDSCAAVSTGDAPVDSTLAQHRLGARGGAAAGAHFSEDEDGEEVEGTIARADRPTSVARAAGSARLGSSDAGGGPAAVDSAPVPVMRVGSIGDGFAETDLTLPFGPASVGMFAMGAGGGRGRGRVRRATADKLDAELDAELGGDAAAFARRQPWDLRAEEMLPAAKTLQTRAAALFGELHFAAAERAYDHALRFVEYEEAFDGDDAKADARRVKVECLVDASACAMRRGDAEKAQRAASRALHFDPGSVPALVRRATARAWGGGEMDAAVADLEEALKLAPNDADAAAEYARVRAMRANGVRDGHANENGVHNGHANGVTRNGISNGGRGGGGRGPATSALKGPPPVPLFNAARAPNETHSPMPPGTAAAARALAAEEAEGECEAQAGAGGMDIGAAAGSEDDEAHEHGYAPASSEEYAEGFGSPGGSVDARLGERDGGGAPARFDGDAAPLAPGSGGFNSGRATGPPPAPLDHGAAFFDSNRDRDHDQRARAAGTASGGFAPPNHPARAAVSGAAPHFSGPRGGLSAGPASGTVSGGGHLGPARSNGGAFPGPATDANGATNMGQTRSASVGRVSMQKNGPPAMARAVVDEGGDESEEDGEEGVSPEFVPADDDEGEGGDDRMDERE